MELRKQITNLDEIEQELKRFDVICAKGHTGTFLIRVTHPRGPAKILGFSSRGERT
jgi:hypothetical protein